MNGLKGEKGDPADVLGSRVSTAVTPPAAGSAGWGTQPEGLPEDPSPLGKGHVSFFQGLVVPLHCGDCPLCRTLTNLLTPHRVPQGPQDPLGPLDHLAA